MNLLLAIIVSAAIDSTAIYIGDQTDMHLRATIESTEQVALPRYGEILIDGIEIVERTGVDTTVLQDGRVQLNQTLTLTSFSDSLFFIPPQPFVSGEDTLWSDGMSLNVVQPFEIDTTLAITDIKPLQRAPIWWWGIIRWVLLAIGCILLGIGAWYFIKWAMHRKKGGELQLAEVEKRPAEEVALEKLDKIKAEKIWQEGKVKEYHTELTDVIREYIGRRYEVKSTEKTSDETLRELKPLMGEQKELFERLRKMLSLADLVKFAKWHTTPDENESALLTAYDFVHETTAAPAEGEQKEEEDMFTLEKSH
ncbi:MAG: hypothetical protein SPD96_05640 [Paludibacteraceae bacterium]|nr:hypothetical protein [Paludibacteraceae bacterium]